MAQTAKFNIGGQIYQVSRSLLEQYPDTMLSKSASTRWQEEPNSEIFIERDGPRFRYVLDYLRDGTVCLPLTESKIAIIKEFEYYGIAFNDARIDDSKEQKMKCWPSMEQWVKKLKNISFCAQKHSRCADLAVYCLQGYIRQRVFPNRRPNQGSWCCISPCYTTWGFRRESLFREFNQANRRLPEVKYSKSEEKGE